MTKKKKDNVVAFYSHTIDRCLITKEEEKKNSYSVIERSAVQVAFPLPKQEQQFLFSSANFSYSSHSEKSDNSCSVLHSSFTLSRQFIQETKDATCYLRQSFPILLKWQTIFPNLKSIWLVFAQSVKNTRNYKGKNI